MNNFNKAWFGRFFMTAKIQGNLSSPEKKQLVLAIYHLYWMAANAWNPNGAHHKVARVAVKTIVLQSRVLKIIKHWTVSGPFLLKNIMKIEEDGSTFLG